MLENWLKSIKPDENLQDWQLGRQIDCYADIFPDLKEVKVALLGTGKEVDTVRRYLYELACPFAKMPIVDIGNLRKATDEFLLPVLRELLDNQIIPILISHEERPFAAQFKAYQNVRKKVTAVVVDERIPFHENDENYIADIHTSKSPKLEAMGWVGYQSHLTPPATIQFFQEKNDELVRLGKAKAQIETVEPTLRNADTIYFNLAALKQNEAPGLWSNTPNGFTSEESCQLCHYAGISDKLTSIGFYGYTAGSDPNNQTAQLIAHMVWYLLEGIHQRKRDFPTTTDGMLEYIVSLKDYDQDATFWKSKKSGRWWLQMDSSVKGKHELIACSYEDYQKACQNELTERVLNILERYL
ncbi:MAG: hypothetical protein AAF960_25020 [Bacteroidota bacterium]